MCTFYRWVQQHSRPTPSKPQVPPKPGAYTPRRSESPRHSNNTPHHSNSLNNTANVGTSLRHSIVSQNSTTGRIETVLMRDDQGNGGDSGRPFMELPARVPLFVHMALG